MTIRKVYIGGWFQRTTLHLTELWNFLRYEKTDLDLDAKKLTELRAGLRIMDLSRESGPLEYIHAKSEAGVEFRMYEDGLIVLERAYTSLTDDCAVIKDYYDTKLSSAVSYLFSKGAPVPKELANIKTILPYIVTVEDASEGDLETLFTEMHEDIYSKIESGQVSVYRGAGLIVINSLIDETFARDIIESQIFFREFKSQLMRYLAIHRSIWEKIQKIKESGFVRGNEIDTLRNELSVYQKTITLIGARLDQMPAYVRTREATAQAHKAHAHLEPLFQSRFETLLDTHAYITDLWAMTRQYLDSTIELFTELQAKSTKSSISSLQLITTIGVVAGILGYLTANKLPQLTYVGAVYFVILLVATWLLNTLIVKIYRSKRYSVSTREIEKNIGV